MTAILLVCLGNICRSPTAEAVLRAKAPHLVLDSAGTGDWHIGDPPHGPMQAAARARGYDLSALRARQVTPADFERFDLILAMDARNLADLEALRPAGARAALDLFLAPVSGGDLQDPYYTGAFDTVVSEVEEAAEAWAARHP